MNSGNQVPSPFAAARPKMAKAAQPAAKRSKLPQQRGMLGQAAKFVFAPEIGRSMASVKMAWHLLVNMVAQLFAMVDLIAKDHACLNLENSKDYKLSQIINIAYKNVIWDAKHIPQIVMFIAVSGFLLFAVLSMVTLLLHLTVNTAHAQILAGNAASADDILSKIFSIDAGGMMPTGLGNMLSVYSNITLVLAGIVLLYIIISKIADTAQSGTPLGKGFNHTWAPIRLVFAIGLLIPLSSGLNSGQIIVLELAKWGSMIANNTYKKLGDSIAMGQGVSVSQFSINPQKTMSDLFNLYACAYAANAQFPHSVNIPDTPVAMQPLDGGGFPVNHLYEMKFDPGPGSATLGDGVGCGYIHLYYNAADTSSAGKLLNAQMSFFQQYGAPMKQMAYDYVDRLIPTTAAGTPNPNYFKAIDRTAFINQMTGYTQRYKEAITAATQMQVTEANSKLAQQMNASLEQMGWITAPIWIHQIAQMNADMANAQAKLPEVKSYSRNVADVLLKGGNILNLQDVGAPRDITPQEPKVIPSSSGSAVADKAFDEFASQLKDHDIEIGFWTTKIQDALIYDRDDPTKNNPLGNLVTFGRHGFSVVGVFWTIWIVVGAILGGISNATNMIGLGVMNALTPMVMVIMGQMLATSIMMGFILPLIPAVRFLSAVLGWVIIVIIAVLGMPLFALAHLKTGGEGWIGQLQVATAYNLILGIILRPTLIVLSFIVGLVLFNKSMQLFGIIFMESAKSFSVSAGGNIIFNIFEDAIVANLLCAFILAIANACFKLTETATAQAFTWMGTGAQQSPVDIGDDAIADTKKFGSDYATGALQVGKPVIDIGAKLAQHAKGNFGGGGGGSGGNQTAVAQGPSGSPAGGGSTMGRFAPGGSNPGGGSLGGSGGTSGGGGSGVGGFLPGGPNFPGGGGGGSSSGSTTGGTGSSGGGSGSSGGASGGSSGGGGTMGGFTPSANSSPAASSSPFSGPNRYDNGVGINYNFGGGREGPTMPFGSNTGQAGGQDRVGGDVQGLTAEQQARQNRGEDPFGS